jgi:hypothetical protein
MIFFLNFLGEIFEFLECFEALKVFMAFRVIMVSIDLLKIDKIL